MNKNKVSFSSFADLRTTLEENKGPFACTSLVIKDLNNNVYHGRGMELTFGEGLSSLTYYPKGHKFQHLAPDQSEGLLYQANYSIMAITSFVSKSDIQCTLEGLNDAGLAVSLNMLVVPPLTNLEPEQYANSIPFSSFGEWALASFSNVEDLKIGIKENVFFWSDEFPMFGDLKSPFHFAVYDKFGHSVVVEVKNGSIIIYDNPTGVMTNGPEFPWHIENLNNYSHLTNIESSESVIGNIKLKQPDSGIATNTVPSSATSVGRFVKAFYYSSFANKVENPDLQIAELGHIMNNFDRPKNITKELESPAKDGMPEKYMTEFTLWIVLTDLSRGILNIRLYDHLNYQTYSFDQFKNQTEEISVVLK